MLKGEAKKNYQREYMRKRRAVRPVKPLDLLDQTLDDCTKRLRNANSNLEGVIKTMTETPIEPNEAQELLGKDDKKEICPACGGKGYREFEAGLIRLPCKECQK